MEKKAIGFLGKPGLGFPPARGEAGWDWLSKGGRPAPFPLPRGVPPWGAAGFTKREGFPARLGWGRASPKQKGEAGWDWLSKGSRPERARAFPGLAWERGLGLSPAKGKLREGAGFK